ncbi:MAG TPA: hypothetical protein GX497_05595 [Bacillus bacterium]|nr:hypothetical protein [Bacillus sp. (in: firmicutes)]
MLRISRFIQGVKGIFYLFTGTFLTIQYLARDVEKTESIIDFLKSIDDSLLKATLILTFLLGIEHLLKVMEYSHEKNSN